MGVVERGANSKFKSNSKIETREKSCLAIYIKRVLLNERKNLPISNSKKESPIPTTLIHRGPGNAFIPVFFISVDLNNNTSQI